jgi:hypothetical protein
MRGDATTKLVKGRGNRAGRFTDGVFPRTIGSFRLLRPLGRGGMAVVYFAEHAETGERVALKTVESADASLLSGIRREIHALRRVDHPGVVRIVAEGIEGDLPWDAMEVVEGRTLREYNADVAELDTQGRLAKVTPVANRIADLRIDVAKPRFVRAANGALPQILGLLRGICDALAFVHGMGLVHRDLKPENVMIRPDGSPVLVDFGLAMQLRGAGGRDVLDLGDGFLGTPAYMAPEQIDGELMDARVDLYALGCIMYESVTGSAPFVGTVEQVLDQHVRDTPQRPSARVSEVPPELDEIILGLLQKRPRDRIGYAEDVAAVLLRLGAGERLPARRAEPHLYRPRLAGRAGALAIVEAKLKNVRVARGARVFVGGESGVGKTRFALEVGIAAHRRGLGIVTGQCVSVTASTTGSELDVKAAALHPFRHLLSTIVDHCRDQGLAETERILGARGPALAVHDPAITALPGQHRHAKLAALDAAAARTRLNTGLAGAIAAFAELQPIVLVLEDLQWADEASMSFLRSLDDAFFAGSRVLLLGTYRSEERSDALRALVEAPDVTHLELGRLDAVAVERMVSDMIAVPTPPADFVRFLVERSEGHPFFVAEYVRTAVREGMLFRNDAGEWRVKPLDAAHRSPYEALPLPELLRDMVVRRIAALGNDALAAARMAAVLGREVDIDVLAAAMSLDDVAQLEALEELRARQIIDIEGGRVRFAHDKLREIIHGAIDADERRRLHAAAGSAIEARYASTPEIANFYPDLVHHFTTASAPDKAFEYLVKAGQAALAATASGEALGFFRRALALAEKRPRHGAGGLDELDRADLESLGGTRGLQRRRAPRGRAAHAICPAPLSRRAGEAESVAGRSGGDADWPARPAGSASVRAHAAAERRSCGAASPPRSDAGRRAADRDSLLQPGVGARPRRRAGDREPRRPTRHLVRAGPRLCRPRIRAHRRAAPAAPRGVRGARSGGRRGARRPSRDCHGLGALRHLGAAPRPLRRGPRGPRFRPRDRRRGPGSAERRAGLRPARAPRGPLRSARRHPRALSTPGRAREEERQRAEPHVGSRRPGRVRPRPRSPRRGDSPLHAAPDVDGRLPDRRHGVDNAWLGSRSPPARRRRRARLARRRARAPPDRAAAGRGLPVLPRLHRHGRRSLRPLG